MQKPTVKKPAVKKTAVKKTAVKKAAVKKTATSVAKKKAVPKAKPQTVSAAVRPAKKGATLKAMPNVWTIATGVETVGLWVDENYVWSGNNRGEIYCIDRNTAKVIRSAKLPGACVALVSDDAWKYAGCANGNVYDLTGDVPRVAYQLGGGQIQWIEIYQGVLACSDDSGTVSVIDVDGSVRWRVTDKKAKEGWAIRTSGEGLYHGSYAGARKYSWDGKALWKRAVGDIRFGHLSEGKFFVTAGFSKFHTRTVSKLIDCKNGKTLWEAAFANGLKNFNSLGGESCGAGKTAAGAMRYYSSIGEWLFCYDADGALEWQSFSGCGALCNMHIENEKLYYGSSGGIIGCLDVSEAAIAKAASTEWKQPPRKRVTGVAKVSDSSKVEQTSTIGKGVVVECVKEGTKLKVRVISEGFNRDWFCQFPRDIRKAGQKYVVDEVRVAKQGGFYRVLGNIKELKSAP